MCFGCGDCVWRVYWCGWLIVLISLFYFYLFGSLLGLVYVVLVAFVVVDVVGDFVC